MAMDESMGLLPGLERLIATCRGEAYPLDLLPPGQRPPRAGDPVAGKSFDPMLAAIYQRWGCIRLGGQFGPLHLYPVDDEVNAVEVKTIQLRGSDEPFWSSLLFAGTPGLAYYYALVPALADPQGLQPVIFINAYDECPVYPVASNVDRFFDLYSRYIELLVKDEAFLAGDPPDTLFPLSIAHLVARDRRLVEMLAEGRFDFLVRHAPDSLDWIKEVCSVRPG